MGVAVFVLIAYSGVIWNRAFGPEFCSFYILNYQMKLAEVLHLYSSTLGMGWYRPTSFNLPYWLLRHFLDWHNAAGWKFAQAVTLIAAAWGIQWTCLRLFPGRRLAAALAACYFAVFPGCYSILLQNSAFDFLHIVLVTGTVGCFLIARGARRQVPWLAASAGLYMLALTAKELTVVTPLYLAAVSAVSLRWEKSDTPLRLRVRREIVRLAPFFVVLGAYYLLHIHRMQPQPAEAAYRTEFNPTFVRRNLVTYPLWMLRVFNAAAEMGGQTAGLDNAINNYSGLLFLLLVFSQWRLELLRNRSLRTPILLAGLWAALFAIVPVYSGGFLWHINLAMGGYAILFGAGLDRLIQSTAWRRAAAAGCFLLLLGLGWWSGAGLLERGIHAGQYKIGRQTLEAAPPVAEARVPSGALIYYEDRFHMSGWSFGGGDHLFKWRYLRPDLREKSVPVMSSTPGPLLAEWLSAPAAFYFVHDDEFRWRDFTAGFRKLAIESLPSYTNELLSQNRNQQVFDLLHPLLRRAGLFPPGLIYYHHAIAAHRLGRRDAALDSFAKAIELEPKYPLAYLNRGHTLAELGRNAEACRDYRLALALDSASAPARRALTTTCP